MFFSSKIMFLKFNFFIFIFSKQITFLNWKKKETERMTKPLCTEKCGMASRLVFFLYIKHEMHMYQTRWWWMKSITRYTNPPRAKAPSAYLLGVDVFYGPFTCNLTLSLGWQVNATIWWILLGFRYAMLLTINVYMKSYVVVSDKSMLITTKSKWNVDFKGCRIMLHKIWLEGFITQCYKVVYFLWHPLSTLVYKKMKQCTKNNVQLKLCTI